MLNKILIDIYGKYRIYKINSEEFRDISPDAQEFGTYGFYSWYPRIIPRNEIWVSEELSAKELPVIVHNALYQAKNIDAGVSQHRAYLTAENLEKAERGKIDSSSSNSNSKQYNNNKENYNPPDYLYQSKYTTTKDGIEVWKVDGYLVRNHYKTNFVEGGHDIVYKWIPKNEIWIEKDLHTTEIPYILIHEYVERSLMLNNKLKYNTAHKIAAKIEFKYRSSHPTLPHIIGSIIQKLTPEWVQEEVKSYI